MTDAEHGVAVLSGADVDVQFAWNNETVTQNQRHDAGAVAPGCEDLARLVTDVLQRLPEAGLADHERQEAEDAANEVLAEISQPEPEQGRLRRSLTMLRGALSPIAGGAVAGAAAGTQEWAHAAINGLTGIA